MSDQNVSKFFYVASMVSVVASIATWVLVGNEDPAHAERFALFIGLWAPTLMGLANYHQPEE